MARLDQEMRPTLIRIAWPIVRDWGMADDAVQEAFMAFGAKFDGIGDVNHRGWLVRATQLQAKALRRKQARHPTGLADLGDAIHVAGETKHDSVAWREQVERLRTTIQSLPDEQVEIVIRRLDREQSFAEIANELGVPLGTVLSRMRLAIAKLRKQMH